MSSIPNTSDFFTFNGGRYRPLLESTAYWTPVPMPGSFGEWAHTRHQGNWFDGDGQSLHTVWTVAVQIFSYEDFNLFRTKYHHFAVLTAPPEVFTGTKEARLANWSDMRYYPDKGCWMGTVTFEWR